MQVFEWRTLPVFWFQNCLNPTPVQAQEFSLTLSSCRQNEKKDSEIFKQVSKTCYLFLWLSQMFACTSKFLWESLKLALNKSGTARGIWTVPLSVNSVSGSHCYESAPTTCLEAIQQGLPTWSGSLQETLSDTVTIVTKPSQSKFGRLSRVSCVDRGSKRGEQRWKLGETITLKKKEKTKTKQNKTKRSKFGHGTQESEYWSWGGHIPIYSSPALHFAENSIKNHGSGV